MKKMNAKKRLGLIGWIKAKRLTATLRRRWHEDEAWRDSVKAAVNKSVKEKLEKHEEKSSN